MHLHKLSIGVASAALLVLAAAAPAAAADPATPSNESRVADEHAAPAHAAKQPEPQEPKKICRSLEHTSSRLQTKKVCLTRELWRIAKYN